MRVSNEPDSGSTDPGDADSLTTPADPPPDSQPEPVPDPAAPSPPDTSEPRAAPSRQWRTPAIVVGIAGVVATLGVGIWAYGPSADSAESGRTQASVATAEASRQPNLKVARALAYLKDDLSGTFSDANLGTVEKANELRGPHIDITFENRAAGPALVTNATLRYREMGYLETCSAVGGPLEVSVNYDMPVPAPLPEVPYEVKKDISFEVDANDLDRLTLTTGPTKTAGRPWYGVVDVILEHDGGKTQTIGPFALVDSGGDENFYPDFDQNKWVIRSSDQDCLRGTANLTDRLLKTPKVIAAKELKSLQVSLDGIGY